MLAIEQPTPRGGDLRARVEGGVLVVDLEFARNMKLVSIVRRFVTEYLGELAGEPELVSRVALTTHELMENAVKYASGTQGRLSIELSEVGQERRVEVRVAHRAPAEHSLRLAALLRELDRTDPLPVYLQLMRETAKRTQGSGLGLARIRVEGEMQLAHSTRGDWVEVVATTHASEKQQ